MIRNTITFILALIFLESVHSQDKTKLDTIFSRKIEHKLISKGDNFPDFNYTKDSADMFLISLHEGISVNDFRRKTKFSREKTDKLILFLKSKNWLHKIDNKYKPTIFIANAKDGKNLYKYATSISKDISKEIKNNLSKIKHEFSKTEIFKSQSFDDWSFLILSNVLLDSWQIDNVEREYLKLTERPKRNGKNYFYTIMENTDSGKESFGIYGNQMSITQDNKLMCIYGNNRNNLFSQHSDYRIVNQKDNKIFQKIADDFFPKLLVILKRHGAYAEGVYKKSGYSEEITFEEFFIWWYHFIYTQATDEMAQKGILVIPENGNFEYELIQKSNQ